MIEMLDETKVMKDPVHGYIHVNIKVIWNCINSKEVQRLRRIHQLGGNFQVYHTAEHSRFPHSLGVYEIVRRMVQEVEGLKNKLSDYEKITVMLAALLHDVGHGPFSHAFEAISSLKHEEFTRAIILGDSEIHDILLRTHPSLPEDVASIIDHAHKNDLLNQIVSSQLDADRMDYLLRDSYFTGTTYGSFDLERVIRTMRVVDQKIVVKESGIHSVEDYIMARYHMYWQVYFHPIARSYETILTSIFKRMKDVYESNPSSIAELTMFLPFLKETPPSIQAHFLFDESAAQYGFSLLTFHEDDILRDLSKRLLNRKLFDYKNYTSKQDIELMKREVEAMGFDTKYYVGFDLATQKAYMPYQSSKGSNIWILKHDHTIKELSEESDIVAAIVKGHVKEDKKVFFPKENERGK